MRKLKVLREVDVRLRPAHLDRRPDAGKKLAAGSSWMALAKDDPEMVRPRVSTI